VGAVVEGGVRLARSFGGRGASGGVAMRRIRFGGYTIEIDPERGMISRHPTDLNLLVVGALSGAFTLGGFALVWGVLFGLFDNPGIPREDWTWIQWVGYAMVSTVLAVMGVATGLVSASAFLRTIWHLVTGRGTQVLDRGEGRCRQGNKTLFELGQVASVGVVSDLDVEVEGEGIAFRCEDGSTHYWLAVFNVGMPKCFALAGDIASFLGVSFNGMSESEKPGNRVL
jgi:hypothetical protein